MAKFLYQAVKAEIAKRARDGTYRHGERIPSESELVTAFNVSTITVRRAIRELIREGLLVGRQGLGVFVTDHRQIVRSLSGEFKASLAGDMRLSGREPGIKPLRLQLERCDPETAHHLRVPPGTQLYRQERLVLADGEAIARGISYIPRSLGDQLGHELPEEFLLEALCSQRIAIDHIDYTIEGGAADDQDAALLGVMVGFPLLIVRYTPIGFGGEPILTSCTGSRYDRFRYEVSVPIDENVRFDDRPKSSATPTLADALAPSVEPSETRALRAAPLRERD